MKDMKQLEMNGSLNGTDMNGDIWEKPLDDSRAGTHFNFTSKLYKEAQRCQSFSGRTLRKLPFLAMTEFEQGGISAQEFLTGLHNCITSVQNDMTKV